MQNKKKESLSRRKFFKTGIGVAGTFVAAKSLAQICGVPTGEQPLGPFFPRSGTPEDPIREDKDPTTPIHLANDGDLTFVRGRTGVAQGQKVYIRGTVSSEDCNPVENATMIVWQASSSGRYNHRGDSDNQDFTHPVTGEVIRRTLDPFFQYWGRTITNEKGEYEFQTIIPGFYPADLQNGWYRPPHIHFLISATGFPQLVTQMYFTGDKINENDWIQGLNKKDLLLQSPNMTDEQRKKLIVNFKEDPSGVPADGLVGRFDITLTR